MGRMELETRVNYLIPFLGILIIFESDSFLQITKNSTLKKMMKNKKQKKLLRKADTN